jgi:hypothetical protein
MSEHPGISASEGRIRRVLAAKNDGAADYWRTRGRERFARELAEDGVPYDVANALVGTIERELFPAPDLTRYSGTSGRVWPANLRLRLVELQLRLRARGGFLSCREEAVDRCRP